jgi:hypothetical protein
MKSHKYKTMFADRATRATIKMLKIFLDPLKVNGQNWRN